ncbi:MAG: TolC family protein [Sedimentisphaerales bacterium]|nr:TolC family protein [Sedimentisphaerales bacterium]
MHNKIKITAPLFVWMLLCLTAGFYFAGCGMDAKTASAKADEKVYGAIEENWQDSFGSPTDYRVDPNDPRRAGAETILNTVRQTQRLTLEQAVQLAILSSPEYLTEVELMYLTGLDLSDAEQLYAFTPFAGAGVNYARTGKDDDAGTGPDESVNQQANIGIQKLLATGQTLITDLTIGYLDIRTGTLSGGSSSLFQTYLIHPLLRGSSRMVVMETLTQAQHNMLYSVRGFNRFRKTFCAAVVSDYYTATELAQRASIARENVKTLEQLVSQMEDLLALGRVTRFELEEAQQDVNKARQDHLEKQKLYAETLDLFKVRLNIPPQIEFDPSPQDWLMLPESLFVNSEWTEEKAVEIALAQRLDLANTLDQVADAQRQVKVAEDALGAGLSLVGYAAPDTGHSSTSNYQIGLQADLPINRVTETNLYKRAIVTLTTQQHLHEQLSNTVVSEVRKSWRDMIEAQNRYDLLKNARELARKRLENTTLLLHYGRANTRDVLDAQEDLYDAEDDFASVLADFAVAQMNFLRDTETLWIQPDGNFESKLAAR